MIFMKLVNWARKMKPHHIIGWSEVSPVNTLIGIGGSDFPVDKPGRNCRIFTSKFIQV
jgi:hypothetical protein